MFCLIGKFSIHVLVDFTFSEDNRMKISAGNNNQVSLGKADIRIMVDGKKATRFIALDAADEQEGFPGNFTVNAVHMEFVIGPFKKKLMTSPL